MRGLADDEVCIGDRYRIGEALFEVSQPRVTCYRVGIRMNDPQIPALLVSHHRPGFYFRVLREGAIQAGDEIVKVAAGPGRHDAWPRSTGCSTCQATRASGWSRARGIPALSDGWKASFREIADQAERGARPGRANAGLTTASPPRPGPDSARWP